MHYEFELGIKENLVRTKPVLVYIEKSGVLFPSYFNIVNFVFFSVLNVNDFCSVLKQMVLSD